MKEDGIMTTLYQIYAIVYLLIREVSLLTLTSSTDTIEIIEHNPGSIQITIDSNPPVVTSYWTRTDLSGNEERIVIDNNRYSEYNRGELFINPFLSTDTGLYIFHADNGIEQSMSEPVTVIVSGSPVVSTSMSSFEVTFGQSVTLDCTISPGSAVTDVRWRKNDTSGVGSFIDETNTAKYSGSVEANPSLTIKNTDATDVGDYWCQAINDQGTGTSTKITLTVPSTQTGKINATSTMPITSSTSISKGTATTSVIEISSSMTTMTTKAYDINFSTITEDFIIVYSTFELISPMITGTIRGSGATVSTNSVSSNIHSNSHSASSPSMDILMNYSFTASVAMTDSTATTLGGDAGSTHEIKSSTTNMDDSSNNLDVLSSEQIASATSLDQLTTATSLDDLTTLNTVIAQATTNQIPSNFATSSGIQMSTALVEENMCPCDCDYKDRLEYWAAQNKTNYTLEELRIILRPELIKLENELRVNKDNLSATIRKLTSANDKRPSSTQIGSLGIVFLVLIVCSVIAADLTSIKQHIINIKRLWNIKPDSA